jgi:sugar lactone lactonase YvrE
LGLWPLLGCADDGACVDHDRDGFGVHCEAGPDCNDDDPRLGASCDASVPDCDDDRFSEGCSCLAGETVACYSAQPDTEGVGMCRAGVLRCDDGYFSACEGLVLPASETCNGKDDDCDDTIDEGVLSPCGGCNDTCIGGVWGPPLVPFVAEGDLDVTAYGELTLRRSVRETHLLWAPNTEAGTVSKIDTDRVREVGRFRTAGRNPTRVAVDNAGDAWVLDATVEGQGLLTKIAGDISSCRAVPGGAPHTSTGGSNVLAVGDDDCVLLSVPVGVPGDDPRALAVDGARDPDGSLAGNVWVGMAGSREVLTLNGVTGELLSRVALPDVEPHVARFDPWGVLWVVDRNGRLASVDTAHEPPRVRVIELELPCYTLEDIAIDAQGRLLLSGFSCENVVAYDPARDRMEEVMTPGFLTPRGIAMAGDDAWVAFTSGQLGRVTRGPLSLDPVYKLTHDKRTPYEAIGVSLDSRGRVWVVSAMGGEDMRGLLSAFDPVSEEVTEQLTLGVGPRALGDMTGMALGGELAATGSASRVFHGCGHESKAVDTDVVGRQTEWRRVHLDAMLSPKATIDVNARWAASEAGLAAAVFERVGTLPKDPSSLPVTFPQGGVVEVRVRLNALGAPGAPRIARVGLEWVCPGPE